MARPTKLTADRTTRVVEALIAGATVDTAARQGGINPATHYVWVERGQRAIEAARTAGRRETITNPRTPETAIERILRVARETAAIVDVDRERPFSEYAEAVDGAIRAWEMRGVATITRAGTGQPYRIERTTSRQELDPRTGAVRTLTTTVVEVGEKVDWRAMAWLLEKRLRHQYGDTLRVEHGFDVDEVARIITRVVDGAIREIAEEPDADVGAVVGKHLRLAAGTIG